MNLWEILENRDHLTYEFKIKALKKVVEFLEMNRDEEAVMSFIDYAIQYEDDDYFGTEGLKVR